MPGSLLRTAEVAQASDQGHSDFVDCGTKGKPSEVLELPDAMYESFVRPCSSVLIVIFW